MTPAVKKGVPFQQEETPTEWELEGYALRRSYQSNGGQSNGDQGERAEVQDVLESYVRGAQQMLAAVLEESERLPGPTPLPARPNLPGLPQWLPPGPGADGRPGTGGGAGVPGEHHGLTLSRSGQSWMNHWN